MDEFTKLTTEFCKLDDDKRNEFLKEKIDVLQAMGDSESVGKVANAMTWSKRIDDEANDETEKMIKESFIKKMKGDVDSPRTDDGDQSPVYGGELQKMKVMWAN